MNDATLEGFRQIADAMLGTDRNWQWIGEYSSQRMIGITRERAEAYVVRFGGEASELPPVPERNERNWQWIGPHGDRLARITRERAEKYAAAAGGEASQMEGVTE